MSTGLRVGLNLLYLVPREVGGTASYAQSLIDALVAEYPDVEFVAFVNRDSVDLPLPFAHNLEIVPCRVRAANRAARYRFEQLQLPRIARRSRLSVLHSLGYVAPLLYWDPQVVTIHDVHVLNTPSLMRKMARGFFEFLSARRAGAIIAPSAAAGRDIAAWFCVPDERIHVVYEAPKTVGRAADGDDSSALARYGIQRPYIVAFSNPSSHKNIARLVRCYQRVAGSYAHGLVLVGRLPENAREAAEITSGTQAHRVRALGYVPDPDVPAILRNADLFVFPSWYEGFGLPALEAQLYGVPLICSSAASLPEVAGDGALYFDPFSDDELEARLRACLDSAELRADLRQRGTANLKRFSWQQAARATMAVYRALAGEHDAGAAAGSDRRHD